VSIELLGRRERQADPQIRMSGVPAASVELSTGWKRKAPALEYRLPRAFACFEKTLQSPDAVAVWQLCFSSCFGTADFHLRLFRAGPRFYVTAPGHILEKQILKPGRITHR
jgi:hypothetical protein